MTGIATVRDREVLSWETGAADYDLYVNGELTDGRAQKWVSLIAQLAGCDLQELSRMTILDIGCGPGFFPCVLGKQGACVVGVDKSSQMLHHARENLLAAGVDALLFHMDAHELDFPDNTFDLIVTRNVTWTLTDPQAAFAEWRRVLRPGGKLLVFDANWHLEFYDEAQARKVRENERRHYAKTGEFMAVCTNDKPYYDSLPLSSISRPAWDVRALMEAGFGNVDVMEDAGASVYLDWEYELYEASPLFALAATKCAPPAADDVCEATRNYWNTRSKTFGLDGDIHKWGDLMQEALEARGVNNPLILDAGCGTGAMSLTLASRGYSVRGVDFSQGMLEKARQNANAMGLEFPLMVGTVDNLPFPAQTFDVVVSRNVLSNIAVAEEALACWCDVLKPGGYLMYFDSSWWGYLHDETLNQLRQDAYSTDNVISSVLENLAKDMDITKEQRPAWDVSVLTRLGMEVEFAEDVSSLVWTNEMRQMYEFAPQFMVIARKPCR